jgi:hypothetical protein
MPFEPLDDLKLDNEERRPLLPDKRPTIKILLYTDDPRVSTNNIDAFGLGTMLEHLGIHSPAFAQLDVDWMSRSSAVKHPEFTLSPTLLKDYDEVWFFGLHQANLEKFALDVISGGPHSELDSDEVEALKAWMKVDEQTGQKGGGVLMTGDHAQPRPQGAVMGGNSACPDTSGEAEFLGLGRALGRCVPRAGLMRRWEGLPTNNVANSFNTQTFVSGININSLQLQEDLSPQQLIPQTFDEEGRPVRGGLPHPLLFYKDGSPIRAYPDHAHEGAIAELTNFDDVEMWPRGSGLQPTPRVIARSVDQRNARLLDIVSVYNGDPSGVGRVVADSSWHHFFNANISTLLRPPTLDGSAGDQIGQFYGNLAIWLSPLPKRLEMVETMVRWLANHPLLLQEVGASLLDIGRKALSVLSNVASACEIHELLQAAAPDRYRAQCEIIYFPDRSFTLSPFPSKELFLGSLVDRRQKEASLGQPLNTLGTESTEGATAPKSEFQEALDEHLDQIGRAAKRASELNNSQLT